MDSDDSATSALTALCEAASKARAVGDDDDGDIPTISTTQQQREEERDASAGLSRARPALTVDLPKAGHSAPKALSSMSFDFANDDEDGNSSMSDSGFSSTNSNSGSSATAGSSTTKSSTGDVIGGDDASSFASGKLNVGETIHISEGNGKSKKRALTKSKKSAHFADTSAKRRKGTASGSSATRPPKGGGKRCSGGDGDELSYAISQLPKPKRPMTAYNFFVQTERKKIVDMGLDAYNEAMAGGGGASASGGGGGGAASGTTSSAATATTTTTSGTCASEPPSSEEATSTSTSTGTGTNTTNNTPKPGEKISFEVMGKTIGRSWKQVPPDDLKRYQALAEADMRRYEREKNIYAAEVDSVRVAWARREALRRQRKKQRRSANNANGSEGGGGGGTSSSGTSKATPASSPIPSQSGRRAAA